MKNRLSKFPLLVMSLALIIGNYTWAITSKSAIKVSKDKIYEYRTTFKQWRIDSIVVGISHHNHVITRLSFLADSAQRMLLQRARSYFPERNAEYAYQALTDDEANKIMSNIDKLFISHTKKVIRSIKSTDIRTGNTPAMFHIKIYYSGFMNKTESYNFPYSSYFCNWGDREITFTDSFKELFKDVLGEGCLFRDE